jgi:RNA polymerase sigma-70 factor (ECF subfamily)
VTRADQLAKLRERILRFAASRIAADRAEDLAQDVLVVLEEKYPQLDRLEDLLPLSLQIMRFKMTAMLRKGHRRGEHHSVSVDDWPVTDPAPNPEAQAERREQLAQFASALAGLGERCREMMRLKLQGRNFIEIQGLLGVESINTIYTWDHRCRQQLRELMGQERRPS